MIEESMVSTSERFIYNSPMSTGTPIIVKKCSARKPLRLFTELLDVKKKTDVCQVGADKSERKAIRAGSMLWLSIPKSK